MWYIFQAVLIVWLINLNLTVLHPPGTLGHIFLFSVLTAYAVTWLLTRLIDLLLYLPLRLIRTPIQSRSRLLGVNHEIMLTKPATKKRLPKFKGFTHTP